MGGGIQVVIGDRRVLVNPGFEMPAARAPTIRTADLVNDSLIYTKMACDKADIEASFFKGVFAVDMNDLPDNRMQYGYNAINFEIYDYGAIAHDGICRAEASPQNYSNIEIHAGQYAETADGYHYPLEGAYSFD